VAGDQEWAEPVEILGADEATTEIEGGRQINWHNTVRTGAAVVAAMALLWIGRSMADERAQAAEERCISGIDTVLWRYENAWNRTGRGVGEPPIPPDVVEGFIDQARECGNELLADALEFEYITSFEEDD
jgi:hypothetical protein